MPGVKSRLSDEARLRFAYEQAPCPRGQYGVTVEVFANARLVERIEVIS